MNYLDRMLRQRPYGLAWSCLVLFSLTAFSQAAPFQANGIKIGEVDQTSALVWVRLTSVETGNHELLSGSAPGMTGEVRVIWWEKDNFSTLTDSEWQTVTDQRDYTTQIELTGLNPLTEYVLLSQSRPTGGGSITSTIEGRFNTPPSPEDIQPILFTAVTGQGLFTIDSGTNGHRAYQEMLALEPDFFVHTGDVLYYDKSDTGAGELSTNITKARQRWNRMFSLAYNLDFHRQIPAYFMKDDHDTLKDDCWPGMVYYDLQFADGVEIFHEQTPSGPSRYRTIRWGKDLQIWLTENREYRNANTDPDGPNKTIWGATQKQWFKDTVQASDATFKLLVSPGAVVGPDKPRKKDNHANPLWQTEGDELRAFIASQTNLYVVCGDRHWQYASIDPSTGVREYCTGAINLDHSLVGGDPGYQPELHTYFGIRGGFLSVLVDRQIGEPQITFRWHDADEIDPLTERFKILYEETLRPSGKTMLTITSDYAEQKASVSFVGTRDINKQIESSTNLVDWVVIATNQESRGSVIEFQEAVDSDSDKKFYRVVPQPDP